MIYLLPLFALVLISLPLVPVYRGIVTGKKARYAILFNVAAFIGFCVLAVCVPVGGLLSASAEAASTAAQATESNGMGLIAAALSTGLGSIGAGIAVAAAAPAAIGATSEDPKSFGKSLIFVALGEGVAIYGLLISILILNTL